MGSCVTKNQQDRDVPRCAPDSYPKNPAYANSPYSGVSAPAVVMPVGGQGNMNMHAGDMLVAGAIMNQQGGGLMGPEMYNPMSGGYGAL